MPLPKPIQAYLTLKEMSSSKKDSSSKPKSTTSTTPTKSTTSTTSSKSSTKKSSSILPDKKPENVPQHAWDVLKGNVAAGNIPVLDTSKKSSTVRKVEQAIKKSESTPSTTRTVTPVDVASGRDVTARNIQDIQRRVFEQTSQIDPSAQYQLDSGTVVSGRELQGMIAVQGARSAVASATSPSPSAVYVTHGNMQYQMNAQTAYLFSRATDAERKNIMESINRGQGAEEAFQQVYENLPQEQREVFNQRFVLPNTPTEEIKYYEGGKDYLEGLSDSEREQMIDEFLENHPDVQQESQAVRQRDLTSVLFPQSPEDVPDGTSYQPRSARTERETAWDLITTPEPELQQEYYSQLGAYPKAVLGYSHAVTSTLASPVTFPQFIIKTTTGKQLGPDVSKAVDMSPGARGAPGLIGGTISEVATGGESDAFEKMREDPVTTLAATGGEIVGMLMLSGAGNTARSTISNRIIKPSIKYTPKILNKFKTITGREIPYESAIRNSPISQQAYKWSHGYQKARVFKHTPAEQFSRTTGLQNKRVDIWKKRTVYKPTRETTWLSPDEVSRFYASLKKTTDKTIRTVGGTVDDVVVQPKYGSLVRSTPKRSSTLYTKQERALGFRKLIDEQASVQIDTIPKKPQISVQSQLDDFTKGSFYRPTISLSTPKNGIIKTTGTTLDDFGLKVDDAPYLKKLLEQGYVTKKPTSFILKNSKMAKFYGSADDLVKGPPSTADEFIKGFGRIRYKDIINLSRKPPVKATRRTLKPFLADDTAQQTLQLPQHGTGHFSSWSGKPGYILKKSYRPTTSIIVPTTSFSTAFGTIPLNIMGLAQQSASGSRTINERRPQFKSSFEPINTQGYSSLNANLYQPRQDVTLNPKTDSTTDISTSSRLKVPTLSPPMPSLTYASSWTPPKPRIKTPTIKPFIPFEVKKEKVPKKQKKHFQLTSFYGQFSTYYATPKIWEAPRMTKQFFSITK